MLSHQYWGLIFPWPLIIGISHKWIRLLFEPWKHWLLGSGIEVRYFPVLPLIIAGSFKTSSSWVLLGPPSQVPSLKLLS